MYCNSKTLVQLPNTVKDNINSNLKRVQSSTQSPVK